MITRTALVTGANRGIGEKIADGLAAQGLRVIIGARDVAAGEETAERIRDDGGNAVALHIDMGDGESVSAAVRHLTDMGETIDALINNAGILEGDKLIDMDEADILDSVAINAVGPLRLIRALAPGMASRGYGRIVNVSSGWGALSSLGPGAYGVTKAFLNAITVKLAGELPAAVKINAMCPGWVHTRMGGAQAPRTPEQGADTAIWLATLDDAGPTGGFFRDRTAITWMDE